MVAYLGPMDVEMLFFVVVQYSVNILKIKNEVLREKGERWQDLADVAEASPSKRALKRIKKPAAAAAAREDVAAAAAAREPVAAAAAAREPFAAHQAAAAAHTIEQRAAAPGNLQPALKKSRKYSQVWDSFHLPTSNEDGILYAHCKYCTSKYKADSKDCGTSNLNKHIKLCKGHPNNNPDNQSKLNFTTTSDGISKLGSWVLDQKGGREELVRMLIMHELPLSFVEHEYFQRFTKKIQPLFHIPSRSTVTRDLAEMYKSEKDKFKEFVRLRGPRVSLTTDTWTSNQLINYMCITVHYIDDDWKLHSQIISFCQINSHKGEDIGKALEQCLHEWGIDRLMCITLDNATSNDVAVHYMRRKFNLVGKSILGGKFLHMRCCAHVINLIVKEGLTLLGNPVEKIRVAVRFFKQSAARMNRFKECVAAAGLQCKNSLILDVSTRWNSTFLMLQSAVALEPAFERYDSETALLRHELESKFMKGSTEPLGMLVEEDWTYIKKFMNFFEHFFVVTKRVSGCKYVTSHTFLDEVNSILEIIKEGQAGAEHDFNITAISDRMRAKFDKYWSNVSQMNLLIFITSIFDPRNKLDVVKYAVDNMYPADIAATLQVDIKNALQELFAEYVSIASVGASSTLSTTTTTASTPTSSSAAAAVLSKPPRKTLRGSFDQTQVLEEGVKKTELDKYLTEDVESNEDIFDILGWWKNNSSRFPILSTLAKDLLAIPITSVSSESAFSTGGRVLNDFRSALLPTTVEALVCTQSWIRGTSSLSGFEEVLHENEEVEQDLIRYATPSQATE